MNKPSNLVLDNSSIRKKITRISFEIFEQNYDQKEIVLIGISDKGFSLAEIIAEELRRITPLEVNLMRLDIDKSNPTSGDIKLSENVMHLSGKVVILIDDVINTASTLMHSIKPFLDIQVAKLEVAVLVNRSHTRFPIHPTYTGYELATTLEEHIDFTISEKELNVYLR